MSPDPVKEMARGLVNIATKDLSPAEIVLLSSHSREKERHSSASALSGISNGHKSHSVPGDDRLVTDGNDHQLIDVSNIHEDLEADDCIIQFGTSLYDHMNLSSIHSPCLDDGAHENSSRMSNDLHEDPSHSPRKLAKSILQAYDEADADLDVSNLRLIVADDGENGENDYEENKESNGRLFGRKTPVVANNGYHAHSDHHLVSSVTPASTFSNRSHGHSISILGSTSSDGHGIALSSLTSSLYHPTGNNAEVETYKMKFNTILLKYNILKNDFEQMTSDLQHKVNESSSIILQLQTAKSK
jgi:hypothetical protein